MDRNEGRMGGRVLCKEDRLVERVSCGEAGLVIMMGLERKRKQHFKLLRGAGIF